MQKLAQSLLAALLLASAGFAHGQVVTYSFTGIGDGSVNGTGFTRQRYTFSVTALASTVQNAAFPYSNVLSGGTIAISGTACAAGCTITSPGSYLVFNTGPLTDNVHGISLVGQLNQNGSTLIEGCWRALSCGGPNVNDNLVTPVPPSASGADGELSPYFAFATSGGVVQITDLVGQITYSVAVPVGAIPTLSDAGLLLLGALLALGVALTRRRRAR